MRPLAAVLALALAGCSPNLRDGIPAHFQEGSRNLVAPRYPAEHYRYCKTQQQGYREFDNTYGDNWVRRRCDSPFIADRPILRR